MTKGGRIRLKDRVKRLMIILSFSMVLFPVSGFSEDSDKKKVQDMSRYNDIIQMEAAEVEGNIEKPEIVTILERKRLSITEENRLSYNFLNSIDNLKSITGKREEFVYNAFNAIHSSKR